MKIFGWMHKKLHLGTDYSRVSHRNAPDSCFGEGGHGKVELAEGRESTDTQSQALLLHHMLDGILTIGTFGQHGPVNPLAPDDHQLLEKQEQVLLQLHSQDSESAGRVLVPAAPSTPAAAFHKSSHSSSIQEEVLNVPDPNQEVIIIVQEEEISTELPLLMENEARSEKRITLAELFAAEPPNSTVVVINSNSMLEAASPPDKKPKIVNSIGRKIKNGKKKAAAQSKKIKKEMDDDQLPADVAPKKLQRLITRMFKKKIHPDVIARGELEESREAKKASGEKGLLLSQRPGLVNASVSSLIW